MPDEDLVPAEGGQRAHPLLGEPHTFDFAENHGLCTDLGLIDYPRSAKLSGNRFIVTAGWVPNGMGAAQLLYRHPHCRRHELVFVPHMLSWECGYTSGQFQFEDEVFWQKTPRTSAPFHAPHSGDGPRPPPGRNSA